MAPVERSPRLQRYRMRGNDLVLDGPVGKVWFRNFRS
jgi:hypothetical protein